LIICFEGPDGAGKSTLLREFNRLTDYEHITVDRLHLSHMVYAQQAKRKEHELPILRHEAGEEFRKFMYSVKPLIVYLYASRAVLEERISMKGEDPSQGMDVTASMSIYDELIKKSGFMERILKIDTTMNPTWRSMTERIVGKIGSLQRSELGRHS